MRVKTVEPSVKISGAPSFSQSIINKRWYASEKTWCFVDEEGGLFTYNTESGKTSHTAIGKTIRQKK